MQIIKFTKRKPVAFIFPTGAWPHWPSRAKSYRQNFSLHAHDEALYINIQVKTGVEIAGLEHIEYLPIMDYKNKSISLESVTSFDVNKTIQRSLTKALARNGLGLYLYAGEDLPEIEIEKISVKDAKILQNVVKNFDEPDKLYATLLKRYSVQSFKELTVKQRVEILEGLNGLRARAASGRSSEVDKQEKAQSDANGSEPRDNAFDRET